MATTTFTLQSFIDHETYRWSNGLIVGLSVTPNQSLLFDFYLNGKPIKEIETTAPDQPWFVVCYQGPGYQILFICIDDSENIFIPLPTGGPWTHQIIDLTDLNSGDTIRSFNPPPLDYGIES